MAVNIDSRPDAAGRFTRVTFDPALVTFTHIQLMGPTPAGPVGVLYALPIAPGQHPAFSLQFRRHDMAANKDAGSAVYAAAGLKDPIVEATPDGGWTVQYRVIPAWMTAPGMTQHVPMATTLSMRPSADPGWVELDLTFPWPKEILAVSPTYAWEPIIYYPRLHLSEPGLAGYRLLDPAGLLHSVAALKTGEGVGGEMPVQFTSLYREGRNEATRVNHVTGVMVMGTDELGHTKSMRFERPLPTPTAAQPNPPPPPPQLHTEVRVPMHLKDGAAVHPPAFTLSLGDANGWGGAKMKWRVRAFHIDGAVPEQPVDWHDVAALYRDWARTRTATLFRKHPTGRTAQGPLDLMSPFSTICHYSLHGDADPGVDPTVAAWLEMHPMHIPGTADGGPDIPNNPNPALIKVLRDVRASLKMPDPLLEAQIWGIENDGYYRYLAGWPPRTNIIKGSNTRVLRTLNALANEKIIPLLTTDPLLPNFNRRRFRGHLRLDPVTRTWVTTIPAPFHPLVTERLKPRVNTVKAGDPARNRVWELVTTHPEYTELATQRKRSWTGDFINPVNALSSFHGLEQYGVCPTRAVSDVYVGKWLRQGSVAPTGGALDHGFRLIEFMKHYFYGCFDRGHVHLNPAAATPLYNNVMGFGPWYIRRMEEMLKAAHKVGVGAYPSFALNNEFTFPEALAWVFDEFYDHTGSSAAVFRGDSRSVQLRARADARNAQGIPVLHFVYSQLLGQRGNLVPDDNINHPGYLEVRRAGTDGRPTEMLADGLDAAIPDAVGWVQLAEAYFTRAFDRSKTQYGLAPVGYPLDGGGTYTYHRAVQDTANLRSRIFRFGAAGVRGERVGLPAAWYVGPHEYNDPALEMGIRAVHMQAVFAAFFRKGYMLGQTEIVRGNRAVRAWRLRRRLFDDVEPLRKDCECTSGISDVISLRTDVTPVNQAWLQGKSHPEIGLLETDKIQHMVWQMRRPDGALETLYVFANVGNTASPDFEFRFTRGVAANAPFKGSTRLFDGDPFNGQLVAQGYAVVRGATLKAALPPRTFLAVHVTPG